MTIGGAPAAATCFSLPGTKKPMKRLSGDQNGNDASSVSESCRAADELRGRTQSVDFPVESVATNASIAPSGERAMCPPPSVLYEYPRGGRSDASIDADSGALSRKWM